jgi:hypothetical protein
VGNYLPGRGTRRLVEWIDWDYTERITMKPERQQEPPSNTAPVPNEPHRLDAHFSGMTPGQVDELRSPPRFVWSKERYRARKAAAAFSKETHARY